MQALLAIPDRQRTDAEWDELNELEIMLAAGNREGAPDPNTRWNRNPQGGNPNAGRNQKPGGGPHGKKSMRKFHKRQPKRNGP